MRYSRLRFFLLITLLLVSACSGFRYARLENNWAARGVDDRRTGDCLLSGSETATPGRECREQVLSHPANEIGWEAVVLAVEQTSDRPVILHAGGGDQAGGQLFRGESSCGHREHVPEVKKPSVLLNGRHVSALAATTAVATFDEGTRLRLRDTMAVGIWEKGPAGGVFVNGAKGGATDGPPSKISEMQANDLALVDLDQDGKPEVLAAGLFRPRADSAGACAKSDSWCGAVQLFRQTSEEGWTTQTLLARYLDRPTSGSGPSLPLIGEPTLVRAFDIDTDGDLDFVIGVAGEGLYLFPGDRRSAIASPRASRFAADAMADDARAGSAHLERAVEGELPASAALRPCDGGFVNGQLTTACRYGGISTPVDVALSRRADDDERHDVTRSIRLAVASSCYSRRGTIRGSSEYETDCRSANGQATNGDGVFWGWVGASMRRTSDPAFLPTSVLWVTVDGLPALVFAGLDLVPVVEGLRGPNRPLRRLRSLRGALVQRPAPIYVIRAPDAIGPPDYRRLPSEAMARDLVVVPDCSSADPKHYVETLWGVHEAELAGPVVTLPGEGAHRVMQVWIPNETEQGDRELAAEGAEPRDRNGRSVEPCDRNAPVGTICWTTDATTRSVLVRIPPTEEAEVPKRLIVKWWQDKRSHLLIVDANPSAPTVLRPAYGVDWDKKKPQEKDN